MWMKPSKHKRDVNFIVFILISFDYSIIQTLWDMVCYIGVVQGDPVVVHTQDSLTDLVFIRFILTMQPLACQHLVVCGYLPAVL